MTDMLPAVRCMDSLGGGFSSHEATIAKTHDWITPRTILDALGEFDLDPCASVSQPWRTAREQYTVADDGLAREWFGRVWLNPPYGKDAARWMRRIAEHGCGTALVFARCDTLWFQEIAPRASLLLFPRGRIRFYAPDGERFTRNGGGSAATAPSVFMAFGERDARILYDSVLVGFRTRIAA